MQSRTSRIKPPRRVVEKITEYLLSQVGVYDDLSLDVAVPPPPRTPRGTKGIDLKVEVLSEEVSDKFNFEAQFKPTNSILYVNLPLLEVNFEGRDLKNAIFKVVAHELVHVYQIIYTRIKEKDPRADSPTAGLPSFKERTPQYRQETGEILHHRLDDNEFYPRLEDTINAIESVSADFPPHEKKQIVSYVLGESRSPKYRSKLLKEPIEWLKDLAKYAPRKYIKAVRKIKDEYPEVKKLNDRQADFFRQISPPDELSTFSNGTPTGKSTDLKDKGEGSQMPNGDGARNIGRPSPDSPNLKSKNLDRSESYGRKPAEGFDGGYVHDSGSGSARVIPYDSGFANNSSPLRKAGGKNVPTDEKLWAEIQALAKGESSKAVSRGKESVNPVNDGKGFQTFPSAYANGWALAQYKRLGGKWKKQSSDFKSASSKVKPMFLGSESGGMAYDFYFMRVEKDYYYHYTYRDRADEIIKDGYLRPNFYKDQPGAQGVFAISGSYGKEVTSLQVSGSRKEHMDKIVALKFKTRTEPKYGYPEEVIWDKPVKLIRPEIVSVSEATSDLRGNEDLGEYFIVYYDFKKAVEIKKEYGTASSRVAHRYLESVKRDDPKKKNTGTGGLGTWFAGHGGGDPDDRATWGDWIAITPVKHTITKDDGKKKSYEPGDIVGPCAVSSQSEWEDVTSGGKKPLKCMPREKAWGMPKKDRAELAQKKRREEAKHRGQKPVNTPTFSDEAKEITEKKKASARRVAYLYLQAAAQPAQDLAGVKTWVDKTRQDQIKNDTSSPQKSREDYEDGKPQRDRVLPLPSGHPEGRDEQRVGPGVINSPPDSSGQGGANRPKKDPSALNDHPDGKALHERPRSSGIPGDQYGNPHIDQSTSTGLKRRVMGSIEFWDVDGDDLIKVALFRYNHRPPRGDKRQREQKGQAKRRSEKYKRTYRVKYRRNLIKQKRLYKRKKYNPTFKKYKKNYNKNPEKYKRRPGGGVSTVSQKNKRSEKRRKKADHE